MIRVLLVEPDYWRRRGLSAGLAEIGCIEVVDAEGSADVVLISLEMLRSGAAPPACAPLLAYGEEDCPNAAADAFARGANGYFSLASDSAMLRRAIELVESGRIWASREALLRFASREVADDALDPQQRAILGFLHEGMTNKEIGNRLGLAETTIKARMNRLYKRFGVTTRLQLLSTALRERLIKG